MKVLFLPEVYQKIMFWVNKSDVEVSGFGKLSYDKESQTFTILDAFMLKQTNGATHTDIDGGSLAKLMYTTREQAGELKFWWHSHVNMSVFWSSTDTDTIKELGGNGWIVASVFNKKNEYKSAVCWKTTSDLGSSLSLNDNVETSVVSVIDPVLIEKWSNEYDINVVKPAPSTYHNTNAYLGYDDKFDEYESYQWGGYAQHAAKKETKKAKKEAKKVTSLFDQGDIDETSMGLVGYGIIAEADMLGIAPHRYQNMVINGTNEEVNKLTDLLEEQVKVWGY